MDNQHIVFSEHLKEDLAQAIAKVNPDKVFLLADTNTFSKCLPRLADMEIIKEAPVITIEGSDSRKDIETTTHVWSQLQAKGASRHSLLLNLGGGMVTDLGGFAASTFKRGIAFINLPTTLLAMVDASCGGKTGVNFGGLKNEIGVFQNAATVIIWTRFLDTLDDENLRSGYAEMLKHALLSDDKMWADHLNFDLGQPDFNALTHMIRQSVAVKQRITEADPHEQGLRKALNLGHTIGHAIESWSLFDNDNGKDNANDVATTPNPSSPEEGTKVNVSVKKEASQVPLLHGYAVAYGLIGELYLSSVLNGFPTDKLRQTTSFINETYGKPSFSCDDYPTLFDLMTHDKKNSNGRINLTLLNNIGDLCLNQTASRQQLYDAFDFIREG